jgi:DNA-binding NarL/FixJ family response regulator
MIEPLTEREAKIATLIGEGFDNKEIATRLNMKYQSVRHDVSEIYLKTGVSRRAELYKLFAKTDSGEQE